MEWTLPLVLSRKGHNSLSWIKNFVSKEKIDCSFAVPGRFYAAHSGKQFDILVNQIENQPAELTVEAEVVPRGEQKNELGSDVYHGGVVLRSHASLDPARYHQGILTLAIEAGVSIISNSHVADLKRSAGKFELTTTEGDFVAREVIIATNGYTGKLTPWLRRRVIPIGSYMIATEPINPDLMNELMPKKRVVSDTRKVVYYYRPSPDGTRIIFGGRVTSGDSNLHKSGSLLRKELIRIFPQLSNIKISHSWMGFVAYTFDELPHIGNNDGLHYAMGCCGSGVGMASYLGTRLGESLLTSGADIMGLEKIGFETRPFYNGNPWFLPASVAYYRWLDNMR
jgi:glycine/D-amino acid oxidase-like deaminating enzyme